MKKSILNVLLFCISIFCGLILMELVTRIFFPEYIPQGKVEFYLNENGVQLAKKNSQSYQIKATGDYNVLININKYGLRDIKDIKNSSKNDIFVVGDSFSFGHGVKEDKRYSNILESKLNIPVYNISIPTDISGYQKLIQYAQQNGAIIKNIVVGVCIENDLMDYSTGEVHRYRFKRKTENVRYLIVGTIKMSLKKYFSLYYLVSTRIAQIDILRDLMIKIGFKEDQIAAMIKNKYSEASIRSSAEKLSEIVKPFNSVIVIIPSRGLWAGENKRAEQMTHNKFISLLQELKLNIIDLRPHFEESGNPFQYNFKNDGHWNEKGHLKVATIIEAYFKSNRESLKFFKH